MYVSLEISEASLKVIASHKALADKFPQIIGNSLFTAATAGSEDVRRQLVMGRLGLTMQNPAAGLAASVDTWWLDRQSNIMALGVPANSPAAAYAGIQERGGVIKPKNAKALAVPISEQAKQYTSPRQMGDLDIVIRKGKPPLLVEAIRKRGKAADLKVHWVLLQRVTIPARHWLSKGVDNARDMMGGVFGDRANEQIGEVLGDGN